MLRRNFYVPTAAKPFFAEDILKELDRAFNHKSAARTNENEYFEFLGSSSFENETGLMLYLDVPGVKLEDIKIEFKDRILTVEAQRVFPGSSAEKVIRKYKERYQVNEYLDGEKISAHFENGVLSLFIPKIKKIEPEAVKIQVSTGPNPHAWLNTNEMEVKN